MELSLSTIGNEMPSDQDKLIDYYTCLWRFKFLQVMVCLAVVGHIQLDLICNVEDVSLLIQVISYSRRYPKLLLNLPLPLKIMPQD